jgi:hypothetical protein
MIHAHLFDVTREMFTGEYALKRTPIYFYTVLLEGGSQPPPFTRLCWVAALPLLSLRALILPSVDFGSQVRQYITPLLLPSQDR